MYKSPGVEAAGVEGIERASVEGNIFRRDRNAQV